MTASVPLSVEITDLANFFSSCARSGASIDGVACQGFAEELIGMAMSAMALEKKTSSAPPPLAAGAEDVVARELAVLEGVRAGKIVDLTGRRRAEDAVLGAGYLGPLGGAS